MRDDLRILAQRIAEIEGASLSSLISRHSPLATHFLATRHSLVELLEAEEGIGAWTLALFMARQACGENKVLVVVDGEGRFYPPAAARWHIDLRRTIVVRPRHEQSAVIALIQSLRCAAVGAALGKLDRLSTTDCRRLQAAAETGGGVGVVVRSAAALNMPSFADLRLLLSGEWRVASGEKGSDGTAIPAFGSGKLAFSSPLATRHSPLDLRRLHVEVVRYRGAHRGGLMPCSVPWLLEIDDEKGDVHLSAELAGAESLASSARASG